MWRKYHKPYHDYQSEYNQCTKLYSEEFSPGVSRSAANNAQYSTPTSQPSSSPYSLPQSHSQNHLNSVTPNSLYNGQMDLCFPSNMISSPAYSSSTSNRPHSVELFSHVNSDLRGGRRRIRDVTDEYREYTQNFPRNDDVITEINNSSGSNMIIQRVSATTTTTDRCHLNETWFGNTTINNNNNNKSNNNNNSYWSNPYYPDLSYMSSTDSGPTWLDKSMTTPASSTSSCIPTGLTDYNNKQTSCYPKHHRQLQQYHQGNYRALPFWSENSHLQDSNLYNSHNPYVQCSRMMDNTNTTITSTNGTSINNISGHNSSCFSSSEESENMPNHHNSVLLPSSSESAVTTSSAHNATPYSSNPLTMNEVSQRHNEQMNNINPLLNISSHQLTSNYQNSFDDQTVQNIPSVNSSIHTYINSFQHSSNLLYSPFLQSVFDEQTAQTTPISSSIQPPPSIFPSSTPTTHLGQYDQFFVNANPISNNLVVCSMSSMDTDCMPFHTCN
ncbi:unnamed protein product [Trichobilharzia szidati]|nr:unnamed protein product [Trichobilharzia szidati]